MFKWLRDLGKTLGLSPAPAKEQSRQGGNKKKNHKNKKNSAPKPSHGSGDKTSPRRKDDFSSKKAAKSDRGDAKVVKTVPPRPEKLDEVPPEEGKVRFLDFPLHSDIQFGVQAAGFKYCTPIQALALPVLLEKRDLAARAQTGTGKTAAFLLAAFSYMLNNPLSDRAKKTPRMLVLAPTRELAVQIHKDAEQLGVYSPLKSVVIFGGMDHEKQRRALDDELDVVIGTPGRVIDYSRSGSLDLSKVEILVIDEADRMLDMGFIPDVKRIVMQLPDREHRQTLMFSATLDESILRLSSGWLADPAVVESEPENLVSDNIHQEFYSVLRDEKLALLLHLLTERQYDRVIIFGNRKDVNLKLQFDLARYGFNVPVLSGDIPQERRIRILEKFRRGEEKIIIATDVAARGIHVDDVSMVINYDLPERAEDYIHRIGRTGRAGHSGVAISFLCEYGAYYLPAIEELLKTRFNSTLPDEEMLVLPPEVPGAKSDFKAAHRHGGRGNFHRRH